MLALFYFLKARFKFEVQSEINPKDKIFVLR